ncbi:GNAT family N-acetyltransferase [Paracoccus pacificus]|uniref:GNAT family N-acetyltransferase n=1 Tax=Paracoccus pacificus TaxID=1463598 RepID=A0ABW4R2T0_9RHOB
MTVIAKAAARDMPQVRALFREYVEALGVDLEFQAFEQELAGLPGRYAPPAGAILLARRGDELLGCVAMRPLDAPGEVEMKRMYLRPAGRGRGLGRQLAQAIVGQARAAGYRRMRLDTLDRLAPALRIYRAMGFVETPPYYHSPLPGTVYLSLEL